MAIALQDQPDDQSEAEDQNQKRYNGLAGGVQEVHLLPVESCSEHNRHGEKDDAPDAPFFLLVAHCFCLSARQSAKMATACPPAARILCS
jgi:hypothetical protein